MEKITQVKTQVAETVTPVINSAIEKTTPVLVSAISGATSAISGAIGVVERIDPDSANRAAVYGDASSKEASSADVAPEEESKAAADAL